MSADGHRWHGVGKMQGVEFPLLILDHAWDFPHTRTPEFRVLSSSPPAETLLPVYNQSEPIMRGQSHG